MNLLNLPVDVTRLILDELDAHELAQFRLVSQTCRLLSDPFVFHTITLHDRPETATTTAAICDRIRNPHDALRLHIRHLHVGPFLHSPPRDELLVEVFGSIANLKDISWNMCQAMPDDVFALIATKWANVRVHVTSLDRAGSNGSGSAPIPIDTKLLSSPKLRSLDYRVYAYWTYETRTRVELWSEFAALKSCLLQATSLKSLHLWLDTNASSVQESWKVGPLNLQFEEGERFPALEELSLESGEFQLTEQHCHQWLTAMDWSKLRRLNLMHGCPDKFISALTGNVPQLQALSLGCFPYYPPVGKWKPETVSTVDKFLNSINGLTELVAIIVYPWNFHRIWDSILMQHGPTLRKLHAIVSSRYYKGWDVERVRRLVENCPLLETLYIPVAMEHDGDSGKYVWPNSTMEEIAKLSLLRHVEIEVIPSVDLEDEPIASSQEDIEFLEAAARTCTINLFTSIQSVQRSKIELVIVMFKLPRQHAGWEFKVRPSYHGESGFVVGKTPFCARPSDPVLRRFLDRFEPFLYDLM